ncbi:EamA family transporter [Bacillus sp. AK128]
MISWYILVLIMTLAGAIGGYFFKRATQDGIGIHRRFIINLFVGGTFYFIGAVLNILVLRSLPYTIVFPLTSITYIWTMILSYFLLSESITSRKIVGVLLIVAGSIMLVV